MKVLLAFALCCLWFVPLCGQTSRALVIAVGDYPAASGWREIHAANDLQIVLPMLEAHGFCPKDITVLHNKQADKQSIVEALSRLCVDTKGGDCIYLHFSCHGQLMADDNGDELDGYDEALIPYDAPRRYLEGIYQGERHLRDDLLHSLLDTIRLKAGPKGRMTVVFDACHSGTADRDTDEELYARGTTYVFAPQTYEPREPDPQKVIWRMSRRADMAALTVLGACLPDQINYEYKAPDGNYYGLLTYALCSLGQKPDQTTADFFERLKARMTNLTQGRKRQQTPDLQTTHEDTTFAIGR